MLGKRLAKRMTKMAQIKSQFSELNGHIADAIKNKDFSRALILDKARQDILRDLCLMDPSTIDAGFFEFIEGCAKDNARLIQSVEEDMSEITFRQSRSRKVQTAYMQR